MQTAQRISLTVAIPVFNEEETLERLVNDSLNFLGNLGRTEFEILIVDDGSTDRSLQIAKALAASNANVRLYQHSSNQGFHAVQHTAYEQARKEWVFILPADEQVKIEEITKFAPLFESSDIILGIRKLRIESFMQMLFSKGFYGFVRLLFGIPYRDYGVCWTIRKNLYQALEIQAKSEVAITELLIKALMGGARVNEVWVYEYPRSAGRAKSPKRLLRIPRILMDLLHLYRSIRDPNHPYHQDPIGYQRWFIEEIKKKDIPPENKALGTSVP